MRKFCNEGETVEILKDTNKRYADYDIDNEGNLIVLVRNEDGNSYLEKVNPNNKEILFSKILEQYVIRITYDKNSNLIYATTDENVLTFDLEGEFKEKLFEYAGDLRDSYMEVDDEGSVYFIPEEYNGCKIFKYEKISKEIAKKKQKKEIKIASCFENFDIKLAARLFERKHPEINITIVDKADKSIPQYLKVINTELMVGKGPDILIGDLFPYFDYMKKNLLIDLNEYMIADDEFKNNNYNTKVIQSLQYDGYQYVFPISYAYSVIVVNKDILDEKNIQIDDNNWSLDDFCKLVESIPLDDEQGSHILSKGFSRVLLSNAVKSNMEHFIDEKTNRVSFDNEQFIELLEITKKLHQRELNSDTCNKHNIIFDTIYLYDGYDIGNMLLTENINWESYEIFSLPKWNNSLKNNFSPQVCAINRKSEYSKESWEFIKFLVSKELYEQEPMFSEFSINNDINRILEELYTKGTVEVNGDIHCISNVLSDDIIKKIRLINDDLNNYSFVYNGQVDALIGKEINKYLDNRQDVHKTVENIENNIKLYLQE